MSDKLHATTHGPGCYCLTDAADNADLMLQQELAHQEPGRPYESSWSGPNEIEMLSAIALLGVGALVVAAVVGGIAMLAQAVLG